MAPMAQPELDIELETLSDDPKPVWASNLSPVGLHYYAGVVDNAEEVLENHKLATQSSFGTRSSTATCASARKPSSSASSTENQNPNVQVEPTQSSQPRGFWSRTMEGTVVEFSNTPFIVSAIRKLDCQFGVKYKERPCKSDHTRLQGTRKIGCKAHINVRTITLYPEFQIPEAVASQIGTRQLKERKKEQLAQLQKAMEQGDTLKTVTKYHILLPTEEAHHAFHETRGAAGYAQRIHPKLIEKIYSLVSEGITDTPEVKRALRQYTLHVLCPEQRPQNSDRSYYPTTSDIRNHIYKARRACELSSLDQENLRLKIEQWQKENPSSKFHFRPYKISVPDNDHTCHSHTEDTGADGYSQTLLYVHQEPWQQELLKRYGNTISLMDATYKTTKYELALFFLAVKTNVGYSVVGEFVVQSEKAEDIAEALSILSQWNPDWQPPYFMTDYSEAEMGAIKTVFPTCQTYLCDFHREQAWERWVKERKHGLSPEDGEILLSFLRDCANAPSPTTADLPIDHHYLQHVANLKKTRIWSHNLQVREWLETKWLSSPKLWVRAFRDREFHAAVNTNNGTESLNKLLKYSFLPRKKTMTLSAIATLITERFLPETYQKYLFLNYKHSSKYRSYKSFVPEYLQGRPRSVILHCLERRSKSLKYTEDDVSTISEEDGVFSVKGCSGKDHEVSFGKRAGDEMPSCTCRDWVTWHIPCKHFFGVFRLHPQWSWNKLPESYKASPYVSSDESALDRFFHDTPADVDDNPPADPVVVEEESVALNHLAQDEIPRQQTLWKSVKTEGQRARTALKVLETLTYTCSSPQDLHSLASQVEDLIAAFRDKLPQSEGIILRPALRKSVRKRAQQLKKYRPLPLSVRRGRKKSDWHYRNRVGSKAAALRKVAQELRLSVSRPPRATEPDICQNTVTEEASSTEGITCAGKKRKRCGKCSGCTATDCGTCKNCLDKPKFGGDGRRKQCCTKRKCSQSILTAQALPPDKTTKAHEGSYPPIVPFLTAHGRKLDPALPDGNCLFHSLSKQLTGSSSDHLKLRRILIDFIARNLHIFGRGWSSNGSSMKEHLDKMSQPGCFGSHAEIKAAASISQRPIYVATNSLLREKCKWTVFQPFPVSLVNMTVVEKSFTTQPRQWCELAYSSQCHYDGILPIRTDSPLGPPPLTGEVLSPSTAITV